MPRPQQLVGRRPIADVQIFSLQRRNDGRRKLPWLVRWRVVGREHSRSFRTRAEAERFRSGLLAAQEAGDTFEAPNGEPLAWQPAPSKVSAHEWARRWLAEQWAEWAPRTRVSAVEALTRLVPLLVHGNCSERPTGFRRELELYLTPDGQPADGDVVSWLDKWCLELGELDRELMAQVDLELGLSLDGKPLSPSTAGRRRKVSKACIRRAVELEILASDPWPPAPRGRSQRKVNRVCRRVDVRSLPDPETMARVIAAIPTHQPGSRAYQVMTAVAYYAGLRPSEVVMLRPRALVLPPDGWGRIDVVEADVSFDEPGEPKTGQRSVPIPPILVALLRQWITVGEFQPDDLLFRTRNGKRPRWSNWSRALHRALAAVGVPPMRVYDCRHAAATTWLAAGAPLGEVARRLGHSVETLVSTYVGALDGDERLANTRIEDVLKPSNVGVRNQGARPSPIV